jgi:Sulfotransferase family
MICHKQKIIFIHIPKCAGSSINKFYFGNLNRDWRMPNYEDLYGWCPKRKIHLQHATSKQLLETELISEENWNSYLKFTFVRNPWDRAYSGYLWVMHDRNIRGSFKEFILKRGAFETVLNSSKDKSNRGIHLLKQVDFFDFNGKYQIDFIGRFEKLNTDINRLNEILKIHETFNFNEKRNTHRLKQYSHFYTNSNKELISNLYIEDVNQLNYHFEDNRKGFHLFKKLF